MEHVTVQGVEVPALGLGTWRQTGADCRQAVGDALDLGYRRIDTAQSYGNEHRVGAAIEGGEVDRDELFLTTKLDGDARTREAVHRSVEESLEDLRTDHVDLLLIHWPNDPTSTVDRYLPGSLERPQAIRERAQVAPLSETLDAMAELREEGSVRNIGVSNFGPERLARARDLSSAPILADQVQYHPFWDQSRLLDYCRIHDVMVTAYSPLAQGEVVGDEVCADIGARYDKSAVQVALRWLLQQDGVSTIPKATSREHLEANIAVFDFSLTDAEMDAIAQPSLAKTGMGMVRDRLPL